MGNQGKQHARRVLTTACATLLAGCIATPAWAGFMASNDSFVSYNGTVTAPDGSTHNVPGYTSTPATTTYNGRDGSVFITSGAPTADAGTGNENAMIFMTNWYASLVSYQSGIANPNNSDNGFVQLYDATSQGVSSATGGWTDNTYTTFSITVSGFEGSNIPGYDRLWDAPYLNGSAADTDGDFGPYTFTLTANFAPGAVTQESSGWYSTTATPISLSGSFSGLFSNTGSKAPGAYTFDLSLFGGDNWAGQNGEGSPSYFGASAVPAPEPAALGLFGLGLLGLGTTLWMRRRSLA